MEILREIYWESKRAPDICTTEKVNPYRRESIRKKFYGKTRQERQATLAQLKIDEQLFIQKVEEEELGLARENEKAQEGLRKKRRDNAARRLKLGFNDNGKEEVEDPVLEELEYKSKAHEKQIEDKKERKPVPLTGEVKGISKAEIERLMLREEEKFRPI